MTPAREPGGVDRRQIASLSDATCARSRADADRAIGELAERQDGVVDRSQLTGLEISSRAIRYRVDAGRLHEVYPGVYSVGHSRVSGKGRVRAATMACGVDAVASHRSAAWLQGLRLGALMRIEVTVPRHRRRRVKGILVHETRSLPPEEVTVEDGIPCTSWARTIVDNAGTSSRREVDRMLERATILRIFDLHEMRAALDNASGKPGVRTVGELLGGLADEAPPTRLEFERRFLELVTEHGLPMPVVNAQVEGHEVDFHWADARLIVETDGRGTHATPYAFERDRHRDLELTLAGWQVIRITWRQLTEEPERIAHLLSGRLSGHVRDLSVA
jgi:very-short-patch-repair endonuclease